MNITAVCFVILAAAWSVLSAQTPWRSILPLKACSADSSFYDVHMVDAAHFFAVGEDGAAHRSSDGGATWSSMPMGTSADLYGIAFSSPFRGVACGDRGTLLRTDDGGASWSAIPLPGFAQRALYAVACVDSARWIAVGGASAIAHGQFGLPDGFVLYSSDAGGTWSTMLADATQFYWRIAVLPRSATARVSAYGPLTGGRIIASEDGGVTWREEATQLPFLPHDISCAVSGADTVCVACGGDPTSFGRDAALAVKRNQTPWSVVSAPSGGGFAWSALARPAPAGISILIGTQTGQIWSKSDTGAWARWPDVPSACPVYALAGAPLPAGLEGPVLAGGSGHGLFLRDAQPLSSRDPNTTREAGYFLAQNFPNPFGAAGANRTEIVYTLPQSGRVVLRVRDLLGRIVAELVDAVKTAGTHRVRVDGSELPGGVYFCTLEHAEGVLVRRMLRE
ncbi:MAG: T9SS type A sorting domain-containing protein [Ignavibacteria bacterium]|nr:T9SS type A sorting domain-containing protein [Ignavibacteria bacterium]